MSYTGIDGEVVKDVARRLRMLNDIRSRHGAGMPITLKQYQHLTGNEERAILPNEPKPVIHRLIHHRDFLHAARLAHYFGTKLETVALQWAISKVQQNGAQAGRNHETHRLISRVLRNFPGVDSVDVANAAVVTGNRGLAVDLLQSDNNSTSEVLLLLQLGYPDLAVEKALGSDDTELVAEILLKLMTEFSKPELYSALMRYPDPSQNIFMTTCEYLPSRDKQELCREFCEHARLDMEFAFRQLLAKHFRSSLRDNAAVTSSLRIEKMDAVNAHETKALMITVEKKQEDDSGYEQEEIEVPMNPDVEMRHFKPFDAREPQSTQMNMEMSAELQALAARSGDDAAAKAFTQHMYLQTQQERLAAEHDDDPDVIGMPVSQTLRWMYKHAEDVAAEELAAKLGVSERAHVLAKLDAWSEVGRWDLIDLVAGISSSSSASSTSSSVASAFGKKSSSWKELPSGCLVLFIEAANTAGQHDRAVQLASRLPSLAEKLEWFVQLDEFQRAADACYEDGSIGMLQQLRKRSQNPQMQKYIDQKIQKLS